MLPVIADQNQPLLVYNQYTYRVFGFQNESQTVFADPANVGVRSTIKTPAKIMDVTFDPQHTLYVYAPGNQTVLGHTSQSNISKISSRTGVDDIDTLQITNTIRFAKKSKATMMACFAPGGTVYIERDGKMQNLNLRKTQMLCYWTDTYVHVSTDGKLTRLVNDKLVAIANTPFSVQDVDVTPKNFLVAIEQSGTKAATCDTYGTWVALENLPFVAVAVCASSIGLVVHSATQIAHYDTTTTTWSILDLPFTVVDSISASAKALYVKSADQIWKYVNTVWTNISPDLIAGGTIECIVAVPNCKGVVVAGEFELIDDTLVNSLARHTDGLYLPYTTPAIINPWCSVTFLGNTGTYRLLDRNSDAVSEGAKSIVCMASVILYGTFWVGPLAKPMLQLSAGDVLDVIWDCVDEAWIVKMVPIFIQVV